MKKFVVLMLVLCFAVTANASLQISVMGNPDPVDSEIILMPSDVITLDIHGTDVVAEYYMLIVDGVQGHISGGDIMQGNASGDMTPYLPYLLPYIQKAAPPMNGIAGFIGITTENPLNGAVVDYIDFHCEGIGDAVVELWTSGDTVVWELSDQLLIHQIPEPMTITLLGLGGLLLRRRK